MKDKLIFDTTNISDSDNIGSYLRSSDGTLITHTNVGGKDALDVNVANTITITATDLDIRDLSHTQDSVKVGDGTDFLAINADGSVNVTDNGGSLTVDAVDFDIRNLDYTQDNVAIKGATGNQLVVNADGSLNVNADISVVSGSDKAEDSASASGDIGTYVLNVRQDVLSTSTSADGDYQSFKSDSLGRLYVHHAAKSGAYTNVSVASTATDLLATDLVNRTRILIQNADNSKACFVGTDASVTTANGIRLSPGSSVELEAGPGVNFHAITASGTADVRVLELA